MKSMERLTDQDPRFQVKVKDLPAKPVPKDE